MRRLLTLVWLLALAACSHDNIGPDVGGSCLSNKDCDQRCLTDSDPKAWPGGFCTVACTSDDDCPHSTLCVKSQGGVCLLGCGATPDCHLLSPDWRCDKQKGFDDVDRNVCVGD